MSPFAMIVEFELRSLVASRSTLIRTLLVEPLAYLLLLTAGIQGLTSGVPSEAGSVNYVTFVYPGIVALQLLRNFTYSTYRLTVDRRWGLQALKFSAGIGPWSYISGHLVVPMMTFCFQLIVTYPVALLLGAEHPPVIGLLGLAAIGCISSLFWTAGAMSLSFCFKSYEQRDLLLNLIIVPLTFAAPVFYSLERAPVYLKVISSINPLTYQVEAMRGTFLGAPTTYSFGIAAFSSLLLLVVSRLLMARADCLPAER